MVCQILYEFIPLHVYTPYIQDGRMKSAIGIGSLLADGLGDTVRVSLTEDPEFELKPCTALINIGQEYLGRWV